MHEWMHDWQKDQPTYDNSDKRIFLWYENKFWINYIIREQLSTVKSRFEYDKLGGWASVIWSTKKL